MQRLQQFGIEALNYMPLCLLTAIARGIMFNCMLVSNNSQSASMIKLSDFKGKSCRQAQCPISLIKVILSRQVYHGDNVLFFLYVNGSWTPEGTIKYILSYLISDFCICIWFRS